MYNANKKTKTKTKKNTMNFEQRKMYKKYIHYCGKEAFIDWNFRRDHSRCNTRHVDSKTLATVFSPQGSFCNFHKTKPEPRRQRKLILYSHPLKRGASITTVKNTEALANSSEETRSVFYCPESPRFIWDFNHTTPFKITVAITSIACPATILLNLLVIIAAKTRRELKQIQTSCCLAWP